MTALVQAPNFKTPMPPLVSRIGRELQRFGANGERLIAGAAELLLELEELGKCIPVRLTSINGVQEADVLMVTSSAGKGLVFPKGGWESDETVQAAAARETIEEAGVRGILEEPLLGAFTFHSSKAERLHSVHKGRCIAYMYVMHVVEEFSEWPEKAHRNRIWVPVHEALGKCRHEWMREALLKWVKRQGLDALVPSSCNSADASGSFTSSM